MLENYTQHVSARLWRVWDNFARLTCPDLQSLDPSGVVCHNQDIEALDSDTFGIAEQCDHSGCGVLCRTDSLSC